ncbi:MAG: sarcosine oxidase subunit delta [Vannielia sp.]|uniref:sarcosine oxidase subunit delta n=1 Tax=Vannielia sp. TaxID=2813045 RepID=UPI003B8D5823
MRIACPLCGARDSREFTPVGGAELLARPEPEAGAAAWDDYLHNRANICGPSRELWYHGAGCASWLVVERDTASHEVLSVSLAREAAR